MRKLVIILLSSVICLSALTPLFAQLDYPYVWSSAPDEAYGAEHRWVWATPQDYEEFTGRKIGEYKEAPILSAKVAAGELPPIEERLPKEPLVVNPYEEIGDYGGTIRVTNNSPGYVSTAAVELNNTEAIIRAEIQSDPYGPRPRPNIPNVAKGWNLSEDFRNITLYLREGLKWSDGEPFTADDIMFWYEDVLLNKDLSPTIPRRWKLGGELWKFKKIDDYTIRIDFAAPNPWALYLLATWGPEDMNLDPKHYLKEFHIKYNPKANELAKEEGFDHWYELFQKKQTRTWGWRGVGTPTLSPYVFTEKTSSYFLFERNPYYWKVDPKGNQLPYLDAISAKIVTDAEMGQTMIVTGQVDFAASTVIANYPMYVENAEKGNYRVLQSLSVNRGTQFNIAVNQTYDKDLVLRDIFRDVRFRRALSLAIDREEINDIMFFGKAVPRAETVGPASMFFEEEFARAYVEYDPEKANALLDEMGLTWDEKHEYRLRPDGDRLFMSVDTRDYTAEGLDHIPVMEMVSRYWKSIGIDARTKSVSRELYMSRLPANEAQASVSGGMSASDDCFIVAPHHVVLWTNWAEGNFGPLWVEWYLSDGQTGERPPEELIRVTKQFEKMLITQDQEEMIRLGKDILRSNAENLWTIGTVGLFPVPIIARNNLRNIMEKGQWGVAGASNIDYYRSEQWFFKHPLLESQKSE